VALVSVASLLALGCSDGDRESSPLPVPDGNESEEPSRPEPPPPDDSQPGPVITPQPTPEPPPGWGGPSNLLDEYCAECHGAPGSNDCAGGVCIAGMSGDELAESGLIVLGEPDASPLYTSMASGAMPPPGSPQPPQSFIDQVRSYIERRAPVVLCDNPLVSWDQLYRDIEADLLSQPEGDRAFLRYLSFADEYNAGACAEDLAPGPAALSKLLNSLSSLETVQAPPAAVSDALATGTLFRIDLRDYGLDQGPFVVDGTSFADGWDAIVADSFYAVELEGPNADVVSLQSGSPVAVLFAGALIDRASVGELYYGLLRMPATQAELLVELGVDRQTGLEQGSSALAATTSSPITVGQRLVVRNALASEGRYYYERFDLAPSSGPGSSVLDDPLGFAAGDAESTQVLFSLPNGLLAYGAFDDAGERIGLADTLFDPEGIESLIQVGVSCMRCHEGGVLALSDEVREHALANPDEVGAAAEAAGFDFADVLALYPPSAALQQIIESDSAQYFAALTSAGAPAGGTEPISRAFLRFDRDVAARAVAASLLVPEADFVASVNDLDPALSGLDNGFGVDRDDWDGLYLRTLCTLPNESANRPTAASCADALTP